MSLKKLWEKIQRALEKWFGQKPDINDPDDEESTDGDFGDGDISSQSSESSEPEADDGSILPSQVKWFGPNFSKAKAVIKITSAKMAGSHLIFKTDSAIPWKGVGAKNTNAIGFLIRKIDGVYKGGKVEWVVGSRGWYDIKTNTLSGYNGSTVPSHGEACWCGLGDTSGTSQCSTLVPFTWD